MPRARVVAALASAALLGACARLVPAGPAAMPPPSPRPSPAPQRTPAPPTPAPIANALSAGVRAGPSLIALPLAAADASEALSSFRESCPKLLTRADASGLTRGEEWRPACDASATWPAADAARFFATYFETARVGDGAAFVTGYYEPEIAGVRVHAPGFDVPVYGLPPDLVRARPGEAEPLVSGRMPLGRYDETGRHVPYYDRAAIEAGVLANRGLEIAWVADPVEFFFLQVQGSGRLRAPDGSIMRIGYAGQNGLAYTGVGTLMRNQGLIGEGPGQYPGSMQGIMRYLRERPEEGRALMRANRSWVFFRELIGDGPIGALGVPVRRGSSVAADPAYVPLGAPVWLRLDRPEANGLWIAQDTGGAIKGANRFDSFWGAGAEARTIAGGMSGRGEALLLLPKGTLARLGAR
ncbi:MAG: murein transglycosylase A [Novosphingobium sp.]